jgi:hypothetical protein
MKNIRDVCIDLFRNEDIKRDIKLLIKPLSAFIYDELYVYIWFICLYHIFIIFIVLAILYIVLFTPINKQRGLHYNPIQS